MPQVVWGVMWMMAILLTGTCWVIYYIMKLAYDEMQENDPIIHDGPVIATATSSESEPVLREVPV